MCVSCERTIARSLTIKQKMRKKKNTMKKFLIEIFDSRNTSKESSLYASSVTSAKVTARNISKNNPHPVVVSDMRGYMGWWIKYENGERTEWSAQTI